MSVSNYEITKKNTALLFLKYDQEEIIRKHHLTHDAEYLYLTFFYDRYRVSRSTGLVEVTTGHGWEEVGFNAAMTIYDYLAYSSPDAQIAGALVPLSGLNGVKAASGASSLGGSFFDKTATLFDKNTEALRSACAIIGGSPAGKGDVSWDFDLFDGYPLRLQFWNADEDFPPQITWFLDKNAAQFMHFETMWYAIGHVIDTLQKHFPNQGSPFSK